MRLILLLVGLLLLQDVTRTQRSHWRRRGGRGGRGGRLRARRYQLSDESGRSVRRRYERRGEDSYEGDHLILASSELARRVNKFERSERRYYPDHNNNNNHYHHRQNTSQVLQATPEYRVQTRGGDTIIEFARSGESQGEFPSL